jgi:hypothetical protein
MGILERFPKSCPLNRRDAAQAGRFVLASQTMLAYGLPRDFLRLGEDTKCASQIIGYRFVVWLNRDDVVGHLGTAIEVLRKDQRRAKNVENPAKQDTVTVVPIDPATKMPKRARGTETRTSHTCPPSGNSIEFLEFTPILVRLLDSSAGPIQTTNNSSYADRNKHQRSSRKSGSQRAWRRSKEASGSTCVHARRHKSRGLRDRARRTPRALLVK